MELLNIGGNDFRKDDVSAFPTLTFPPLPTIIVFSLHFTASTINEFFCSPTEMMKWHFLDT